MKTLSATKARQKLDEYLAAALRGEDIGIVHSASGQIVALRPVSVYSEDYPLMEYGVSGEQLKRVEKKLTGQKGKVWDGTTAGLRG